MAWMVTIDNGSTFTDACLLADGALTTVKVLTTPYDLMRCFADVFRALAREAGLPSEGELLRRVEEVRYSTTSGTNALLVRKGVMVLNLLRYPTELRDPKDIEVPGDIAVSAAELKMAERLVQGMTGKWNPKEFKDQYREDVMKMIERRVKAGQTETIGSTEEGEEARPSAEIKDLMPLLKKSLESHDARGSAPRRAAAAPRAAAKAPKAAKAKAAPARKKTRTA